MAEMMPDLSLVRRLKAKGRYEEAQRQLQAWLDADPENPRLLFEMAVVLDNQGLEDDAIPYYQAALSRDLNGAQRVEAYLGLGSSLRVVGRVFESYQVMSSAVEEYPQHLALKVFYALTLERMGNFGDAVTQLLNVVLECGKGDTLDAYRPALRYYREHRHDGVVRSAQPPQPEG